jgi:hypothetical protein
MVIRRQPVCGRLYKTNDLVFSINKREMRGIKKEKR